MRCRVQKASTIGLPRGRPHDRQDHARRQRFDRNDHEPQRRQTQCVRRRNGRPAVRDLRRTGGDPDGPSDCVARRGKSWSSGRDVSAIGTNVTEMTHHELMSRGHAGIQKIWSIEAPIIVAIQGWAIGGRFNEHCCATSASRRRTLASCPRARSRRHPRHRRHGGAIRDVRPRPRERHGADRPPSLG